MKARIYNLACVAAMFAVSMDGLFTVGMKW
jgi:hypothetical protein